MVAAVFKENLEKMIRFPDIRAEVSASDCCSFVKVSLISFLPSLFLIVKVMSFFHLVQVMESVLRFVFIEHLNNVKAEKYWGPDAPRLVFQFEVRCCFFCQILADEEGLATVVMVCLHWLLRLRCR
jgi:hypothetical protein